MIPTIKQKIRPTMDQRTGDKPIAAACDQVIVAPSSGPTEKDVSQWRKKPADMKAEHMVPETAVIIGPYLPALISNP